MKDEYKQFFDLVKHIWKETNMAKDTITGIITRLCPHITTNKKKDNFCSKTLAAIEKYWPDIGFYERFHQINKAAGLDRFFRYINTVTRRYKGLCQIYAVWAINCFMAHKIFNADIGVASDGYKYYIINDFKKLLKVKNGLKNTLMITSQILVKIGIYNDSTGSLDNSALDIMISPDKKI